MATFGELMDDLHHLSNSINALLKTRDDLLAALIAAAEAIRDFDGGNTEEETGWKHDELREAWLAARDVIERAESAQ